MSEAQEKLGVSRKTLLKHIQRAGIQFHFDVHDYRKKLLDEGQVAQLEEIVSRIKYTKKS